MVLVSVGQSQWLRLDQGQSPILGQGKVSRAISRAILLSKFIVKICQFDLISIKVIILVKIVLRIGHTYVVPCTQHLA